MSLSRQGGILKPVLAAGEIYGLNVAGRVVQVLSAGSPIGLKIGEQPKSVFRPGTGCKFQSPDEFKRIEVTNEATFQQKIELWVGYSEYIDIRQTQLEPETELKAWDGTQIGAGLGVTFPPVLTGTRIRRKAIMFDNQDPTSSLQWRDVDGNVGGYVRPDQIIQQPLSGTVELFNPTGGNIACSVSEIYWLDT
jgi:hypothetical protein